MVVGVVVRGGGVCETYQKQALKEVVLIWWIGLRWADSDTRLAARRTCSNTNDCSSGFDVANLLADSDQAMQWPCITTITKGLCTIGARGYMVIMTRRFSANNNTPCITPNLIS